MHCKEATPKHRVAFSYCRCLLVVSRVDFTLGGEFFWNWWEAGCGGGGDVGALIVSGL